MVIVMVWNYGGFWKACVGKKENVGHAAVRIITDNIEKPFYISWWPGDTPDNAKKGRKTKKSGRLPDPHDLARDLLEEGDKLRNKKEFRAFVKKLKKEMKSGKQFVSHNYKKLGNGMTMETFNQKLQDHKELTGKVIQTFKTTDNQTEYERYYYFLEDLIGMGGAEPHLVDLYLSLADPRDKEVLPTVHPADTNIHLPGLSNGNPAGLNDGAMVEWWVDYVDGGQRNERRYRFLKENCSTISYLALFSGGSGIHASLPSLTLGHIWKPNNIKKYANNILISIAERTRLYHQFIDEHAKTSGMGDIWSTAKWKKYSAVKRAHRYKALSDIDTQLSYYHRLPPVQMTVQNLGHRIMVLTKILTSLQQILNDRPNTKRYRPIAALGNQCLGQIQLLMNDYIPTCHRTFFIFYEMLAEEKQKSNIIKWRDL